MHNQHASLWGRYVQYRWCGWCGKCAYCGTRVSFLYVVMRLLSFYLCLRLTAQLCIAEALRPWATSNLHSVNLLMLMELARALEAIIDSEPMLYIESMTSFKPKNLWFQSWFAINSSMIRCWGWNTGLVYMSHSATMWLVTCDDPMANLLQAFGVYATFAYPHSISMSVAVHKSVSLSYIDVYTRLYVHPTSYWH